MQHYFKNHDNFADCVRKLCTDFGRREAPFAPYARYLVKKVKESGILINKPKRGKPKIENTAAVAESVHKAASTPIHRCLQQLNISQTSFR